MIVRSLADVDGTDRDVRTPSWSSRRLLLAEDGMGFSLHDTIVHAGAELRMCYLHHLEAVYCVEGEGSVEAEGDGRVHELGPGTVYALDRHDAHVLRARTSMRLVCVFNPPLVGRETHGPDGAYPPGEAAA